MKQQQNERQEMEHLASTRSRALTNTTGSGTQVKERPILFSAPMVRAILDGRKTQTRRTVKRHNIIRLSSNDEFRATSPYPLARDTGNRYHYVLTEAAHIGLPCPYGAPGDRLWVRETWREDSPDDPVRAIYRADPENEFLAESLIGFKWKPSIFMPRWASRLTLDITDVRVQRLQDISVEDCRAEGIEYKVEVPTKQQFQRLWDDINAKRAPWSSNPWVWALTFRLCEPQDSASVAAGLVLEPSERKFTVR
jgi:hypothetical protein